jgi:regulator of CtrA degradation
MANQPIFLLDKVYDDVYALLLEARGYMAYIAPMLRERMQPDDRLFVTYQSTRLTSRLLEMMSWLMAQKAIHNREISALEARNQGFIISNDAICGRSDEETSTTIPEGLRSMLKRSATIYERLARLDGLAKQAAA